MDTQISISTAARMLGVCVDTLRRWDATGKLRAARTPTGHRRYLLKDIRALAKPANYSGQSFATDEKGARVTAPLLTVTGCDR